MEVIIYTQNQNRENQTFLKEINNSLDISLDIVFDLQSLFDILKHKLFGKVIVVVFVSHEVELDTLISSQDKLFNSHFILILPDNVERVTSKALSLYPRYITTPSRGFKDVCAVLNKMIRNDLLYTKMLKKQDVNKEIKNQKKEVANG